jgi:bacillolysin
MKKRLHLGLMLCFIIVAFVCFSFPSKRENSMPSSSVQLSQDLLQKKVGKWYFFKKGSKVPVEDLFKKNYVFFDLPEGINGRIEKKDVDEFSLTHYLIKLEIKGIPIEDAFYTAHYSKTGELMHVVGKYKKDDIPINENSPKISKDEAFSIAKNAFISSYNIRSKDFLIKLDDELNKSYFDKSTISPYLVYFHLSDKDILTLCYRVDISSEIQEELKTIYINCLTGAVVKIVSNSVNNTATIATVYNGSKSVQVEWRGWPYSYYYLLDDSRATTIETRNSDFNEDFPWCVPWGFGNLDRVSKGDLSWPIDFKYNAGSSHWALTESYNVFKNTYGRTYGTFTTSGGEIRMENNYISLYQGNSGPFYAFTTSDDYIHVGQTLGSDDGFEGSLDVIGHEFTHGVMYRAREISGSAYGYAETGAIMESFADIFGIMIEYFTLGQTDYIVGTNLSDYYKRSIQNPKTYDAYVAGSAQNDENCKYELSNYVTYEYPTYWHEAGCWIYGTGSLPAHINNSVQNYWFYLLANGGTQNNVTVTGIGLYNASRIAYHNMAYYFTLGDSFEDMRQASIESACLIFGPGSNEIAQVMNAWDAVGVEAQGPEFGLSAYIEGPQYICSGTEGYWSANINTCACGDITYTWTINGNFWSNDPSWYFTWEYDDYLYLTIGLTVTLGDLSANDEIELMVYPCEGEKMISSNKNPLKLSVYPNPATVSTSIEITDLNSTISENEVYTIEIVNNSGQVIYSKTVPSKNVTIETSQFQKGLYSIIAKSGRKFGRTTLIKE